MTARPAGRVRFTSPSPLRVDHDCAAFDSDTPDLDNWLRDTALHAERLSARTYVVCNRADGAVAGYYCLATGALLRAELPSARLRRNLPDPVPITVIGRLAVDRRCRGLGLGAGLLRDAINRSIALSDQAGMRAIVVHVISEAVSGFYRKYGFIAGAISERTLILPIESARASFSAV